MSEEQLKAFMEAVKADAGLQEKLNAAADVDVVVEIAKEAGFMISAEELKMSKELSEDDELESVAGGMLAKCLYNSFKQAMTLENFRCGKWKREDKERDDKVKILVDNMNEKYGMSHKPNNLAL